LLTAAIVLLVSVFAILGVREDQEAFFAGVLTVRDNPDASGDLSFTI